MMSEALSLNEILFFPINFHHSLISERPAKSLQNERSTKK